MAPNWKSMDNLAAILPYAARRFPRREAVRWNGTGMAYHALDRLANQFAAALRSLGVQAGERVGVLGFKSAEIVAALQGVMRADAVYVPLDPRAPAARLCAIAADCGLETLVVDDAALRHAGELSACGVRRWICTQSLTPELPHSARAQIVARTDLERQPGREQAPRRGRHDLAYILYTSGSTGRPKGVMISHENALTFIRWADGHFGVRPSDRLLNHAPLTFDLPVFDLYNGFAAGATVVLLPETSALFPSAVVRTIEQEQITSLYMVPSALVALQNRGELGALDSGRIRRIMYSGEAFPLPALRTLRDWAPRAHVCNLYGPIETNACTFYDVGTIAADATAVPIGCPIDGVEIVLRGEAAHEAGSSPPLAAACDRGEICVRGGCVTLGYWGNEAVTRSRRVTLGEREYFATGDLGERDSTGDLWFHGRRDHLVKSRGFRIELGDIEHALCTHPEVAEAAVVALPDPEIGAALVAAFVPRSANATVAALKAHLGAQLPPYMVPGAFLPLAAMPKTSTGKTSRQELQLLAAAARDPSPGTR